MRLVLILALVGGFIGAGTAVQSGAALAIAMALIGCIGGAALAGPVLALSGVLRAFRRDRQPSLPAEMDQDERTDAGQSDWHWRDPAWRGLNGLPREID